VSALRVVTHAGTALQAFLPDIARLRIKVFRDWPYLYDGDAAYEQRYLQTYIDTPEAMVAICFDGDRVVGASTALPLAAETTTIQRPFVGAASTDTERSASPLPALQETLYLGESVLDPAYRGRGIGVEFFARREAHARRLGLRHGVFCAVQRASDDPRRPIGHVALDGFWRHRGYAPLPGCTTRLSWREIGADSESAQTMQFWHRSLGEAG